MNYFEKLYFIVFFIVVFDDFKWSKSGLKNKINVYILIGNFGFEDMVLLLLINYIIMLVGIFGWWVVWMIRGIIFYYK